MEVWLAGGFLPLLLLAWLPSGLTHDISGMINVSVSLDLSLQHLPQTGSNGTSGKLKCFSTTQNNGEKQNKGGAVILNSSIQLVITSANKTYTGTYTCRMENTTNMCENGHSKHNKNVCCPETPQFNVTNENTWTGPNFPLCIFLGLAVGTLLYMPIICLLLWQRRRNSKGMPVAEGNQLSMAAPVTGTEDLTYANLKFEKKTTKPTSSDVIYTDIKPPPQKQSGEDAGAAKAGVGVSPKGEDK